MLTEETAIDLIQVLEDGQIQTRQVTRILRDGMEFTRTYQRAVLKPGDDMTGKDERLAAIASAAWTPKVIADFLASRGSKVTWETIP